MKKKFGIALITAGVALLCTQALFLFGKYPAFIDSLPPAAADMLYYLPAVSGAVLAVAGFYLRFCGTLQAWAPLFILPMLIPFCIGFVWPFLQGIYLSFFRFKTLRFTEFAGLDNYRVALSDATFLYSFGFTLLFCIVSVISVNLAAFFIALALSKKLVGGTFFRTVFFMPNLIGGIVLGYIWKLILDGVLVAQFSSSLSLNPTYGFWGLVIVYAWQQIGYMMIIYIAGLQNIPHEYVEAARIDGADGWQILRHITIPSVMPAITICTFLSLTGAFKLFDQNLALTAGQPFRKTEMLALNIYNSFYNSVTNMGVGQAKAVLFFIAVVAIALSQLYLSGRREVQR